MARIRRDDPLLPSILDRLIDANPSVESETAKSRSQVLNELKKSVRNDLEHLLNTRQRCLVIPEGLSELQHSLVSYGIPDLSAWNIATPKSRKDLMKALERIIKRWEPRFEWVKLELLDDPDPRDRAIHFRVHATLKAEPAPEPVVFDSAFEPSNVEFSIKE